MVVVPTVIHLQLSSKVLKRIEKMGCVKTLVIFSMAALYLSIVTWCKRTDDLVSYPMRFQVFLKERRLVPVSSKTVGKFRTIIRLDALDGEGKSCYKVIHKLCRRIGAVFLKGFHETPSGILINGSVLEELFSNDSAVFEAGGRDKFNIHLDTLPRVFHLLIRLRDVLWIGRMDRRKALFFEEAVESWYGAGIAALPELDPENDETSIRVTASHIEDKLLFLRSMLVRVMVRASGTISQGVNGAIKTVFPTVDILAVGLVFNSCFSDAKLLSIADQG